MRVLVDDTDPRGAQHPAGEAVEFEKIATHIRQVQSVAALIRCFLKVEATQEGGFARPAFADDAQHLTRVDRRRNVAQRLHRPITQRQALCRQQRTGRGKAGGIHYRHGISSPAYQVSPIRTASPSLRRITLTPRSLSEISCRDEPSACGISFMKKPRAPDR